MIGASLPAAKKRTTCTFCAQCVDACPVDALAESPDFLLSDTDRSLAALTVADYVECPPLCGSRFLNGNTSSPSRCRDGVMSALPLYYTRLRSALGLWPGDETGTDD